MNSSASYSILTVGEFVIEAHFMNHFGFLISDKNSLSLLYFLRCCHVYRLRINIAYNIACSSELLCKFDYMAIFLYLVKSFFILSSFRHCLANLKIRFTKNLAGTCAGMGI